MGRQYFIPIDEASDEGVDAHEMYDVEAIEGSDMLRVTLPSGEQIEVSTYVPEPGFRHIVLHSGDHAGEAFDVSVRDVEGAGVEVEIDARRHTIDVVNARQKRMIAAGVGGKKGGGPELTSPMAGKVVALQASVGEQVDVGQCVLIVEAMKMENDLKAHIEGTIAEIRVEPGQTVEIGDVLVVIDPS